MQRILYFRDATQSNRQCHLHKPGLLVGTHELADITLNNTDSAEVPFQVAIRSNDQQVEVINLSANAAAVMVQNQPAPFKQTVVWPASKPLTIGSHTLRWELQPQEDDVDTLPPTTTVQPAMVTTTEDAVVEDLFSDLLSGPGTVPIGADPSTVPHPFSMNDHMHRNSEDPLAQLNAKETIDRDGNQVLDLLK